MKVLLMAVMMMLVLGRTEGLDLVVCNYGDVSTGTFVASNGMVATTVSNLPQNECQLFQDGPEGVLNMTVGGTEVALLTVTPDTVNNIPRRIISYRSSDAASSQHSFGLVPLVTSVLEASEVKLVVLNYGTGPTEKVSMTLDVNGSPLELASVSYAQIDSSTGISAGAKLNFAVENGASIGSATVPSSLLGSELYLAIVPSPQGGTPVLSVTSTSGSPPPASSPAPTTSPAISLTLLLSLATLLITLVL